MIPRNLLAFAFALLTLLAPLAAPAYLVTPLNEGLLAVEVPAEGATREEAVELAKRAAVQSVVGRVYLSEYLTLADSLLVRYLDSYGNDFVRGVEVLSQDFQAGVTRIQARVYVDYQRLITDLDEKKFLYVPQLKPRFAIFMTEQLDGQYTEEGIARSALEEALRSYGLRAYEGELPAPPASADVSADPFLLEQAQVSAQRAGVEIVLSGETTTQLRETRDLYYDSYSFYESEMTASLVRVDTGEILFTATASGTASDRNATIAIRTAIERAADQVAQDLIRQYDEFWPAVVQRGADYQVLLTGITDELLNIITSNLSQLGGGNAQVYVRKRFDRTAVLSIVYDGEKEDLLGILQSMTYPTLSILEPQAERYFEVQVTT